ncbi:MAG: hypothetical protein GC139_03600 [Sideroxydans sp.]|nr:hypothetical protein [Sideroxydans sp.]
MRTIESQRAVLAWLALAVLLCYGNAFFGTFQFDDYKVIVDYPRVHSWHAWLASHGIRPLLKFTYTLDWTLHPGTFSFHFTNLLLHLANTWLVYRLCGEFVRHQLRREQLRYVPLFAALLFATHPAHTEAVTYISGRSISLMTLLYLGALLAYVTGRTQHSRLRLYLVTPLLFVLALSVKETAVTFPLALLAWELCCGGDWRPSYRKQWPSWAVLLAGSLFFLFNASYLAQVERSVHLNSFTGNIATQLMAYAYLLRQWALPLWLNIDPDLTLQHDFSHSALPLLLFASSCALMVYFRRNRPWLSFALAWVVVQLFALYIFVPRVDIANDRQLYLADWPLLLALSIELARLLNTANFRRAAAALLVVFATLTIARNRDYASEIALWESTVKLSPDKARVHNNLGYAYLLARRSEDARREFAIALQLDPCHIKARSNLERLELETPDNPAAPADPLRL